MATLSSGCVLLVAVCALCSIVHASTPRRDAPHDEGLPKDPSNSGKGKSVVSPLSPPSGTRPKPSLKLIIPSRDEDEKGVPMPDFKPLPHKPPSSLSDVPCYDELMYVVNQATANHQFYHRVVRLLGAQGYGGTYNPIHYLEYFPVDPNDGLDSFTQNRPMQLRDVRDICNLGADFMFALFTNFGRKKNMVTRASGAAFLSGTQKPDTMTVYLVHVSHPVHFFVVVRWRRADEETHYKLFQAYFQDYSLREWLQLPALPGDPSASHVLSSHVQAAISKYGGNKLLDTAALELLRETFTSGKAERVSALWQQFFGSDHTGAPLQATSLYFTSPIPSSQQCTDEYNSIKEELRKMEAVSASMSPRYTQGIIAPPEPAYLPEQIVPDTKVTANKRLANLKQEVALGYCGVGMLPTVRMLGMEMQYQPKPSTPWRIARIAFTPGQLPVNSMFGGMALVKVTIHEEKVGTPLNGAEVVGYVVANQHRTQILEKEKEGEKGKETEREEDKGKEKKESKGKGSKGKELDPPSSPTGSSNGMGRRGSEDGSLSPSSSSVRPPSPSSSSSSNTGAGSGATTQPTVYRLHLAGLTQREDDEKPEPPPFADDMANERGFVRVAMTPEQMAAVEECMAHFKQMEFDKHVKGEKAPSSTPSSSSSTAKSSKDKAAPPTESKKSSWFK